MTSDTHDAIEYLGILLEQCELFTAEPHLKPYHIAALIPIRDTLQESLVLQLKNWRDQPVEEGDLLLTGLSDWKREINDAPFFSAGFFNFEPIAGQSELKAQFFELLASDLSSDAKGFRLASYDSAKQPLYPYGGLHDTFVLVDHQFAVLIDFDWDS